MKRLAALFAAAFCAPMLAQGCANGQRTTSVTTVTRVSDGSVAPQTLPGDDTADPVAANSDAPSATTTTTTTTTQPDESDSVLGATLHLVGTIITLPFRIVGDILGAIF